MDRHGLDSDVRPATDEDRLAVRRLLDAAVLAVERVDERLDAGDVLVAVVDGRVVGVAVLDPRSDGAHIDAIAVRRRRRGRGVGTALIEYARTKYGPLTAAFDADVRSFYESLGFAIEPIAEESERFEGVLE
ncbi:N-acetylglutamate synthase, GNAT family [Natronoarchaeum philippinense]|uniref:N-acetylglutamate synthase, GNAT family n=1 Tax=Natronoarchaeum philippinense TaxID=558529 RepID=A0A285P2U7_NATPI|nr:GNAT family N-acetyltransferase [Natronoarchaeum philippinense]SNZ15758.1 N-acetylglutamate synthase, GNAT family [Natronoarchaeum philippinense]